MKWIALFFSVFIISFITCQKVFEPEQHEEILFNHPKFSDSENQKMTVLLNNIPVQHRSGFEIKFSNWKDTWNWDKFLPCSNPRCWSQSDQYENLLQYCKNLDSKIWPMVFQAHVEDDRYELTSLLIEDLTFKDFGYIFDDIRSAIENDENKIWTDFWIYYIQEILKYYDVKTGEIVKN